MDTEDPDITILDTDAELFHNHAATHNLQEFQLYRGPRDSTPSGDQDPYHALSLAYHDLKKRFNTLQEKVNQDRARQRGSISGDSMSRTARDDSSSSRENTPVRDFNDGRRSPQDGTGGVRKSYQHSYYNGTTAIRNSVHLETDSCNPGTTIITSTVGDTSCSLAELDSMKEQNRRLARDLEESQREKNSLHHKLVGYEQVYSKITKGRSNSAPRGLDAERETLELQKQVQGRCLLFSPWTPGHAMWHQLEKSWAVGY